MKKLFTLFSVLCLFGIFGAKAQWTWNFEFTGTGLTDIYKSFNVTAQTNDAANTPIPLDVTGDSFSLVSSETNIKVIFEATGSLLVSNIQYGNSSKYDNTSGATTSEIVINPGETSNPFIINVVNNGDYVPPVPDYITATYDPASAIKDVYVNNGKGESGMEPQFSVALTDINQIMLPENYRGDYFSVQIVLEDGADFDSAIVTYKYGTTTADLKGNFVAALGDVPAYIEIANIPFSATYYNKESVLSVTLVKTQVTYSVNFVLDPSNVDTYKNVNLTVNDSPVALEDNSYSVTVGDTDTTLVFEGKEGYYISAFDTASGDYAGTVTLENGILTVEVPSTLESNDSFYITVAESNAKEVPVTFNISEYPGLIAALGWNGGATTVSKDADLTGYFVTFPSNLTEEMLTITFSTTTVDNSPVVNYVVTEATATVTTADGDSTVDGLIADDGSQAYISIPASATAVSISFVASENEAAGISSINAVNGDAVIYNMQGVRVNNPSKGLYIINGKKVLVK